MGAHVVLALLGLIVFGTAAIFISIPNSNLISAIAGLGIFTSRRETQRRAATRGQGADQGFHGCDGQTR